MNGLTDLLGGHSSFQLEKFLVNYQSKIVLYYIVEFLPTNYLDSSKRVK